MLGKTSFTMTTREWQKTIGRIQENRLVALPVSVSATLFLLGLSALLPYRVSESISCDTIENAFLFAMLMYVFASTAAIWSAFTRNSARRRVLLICAWTITVILLTVARNLCWDLKDPVSLFGGRSAGITAVGKFAKAMWIPYGVIVILPVVCTH